MFRSGLPLRISAGRRHDDDDRALPQFGSHRRFPALWPFLAPNLATGVHRIPRRATPLAVPRLPHRPLPPERLRRSTSVVASRPPVGSVAWQPRPLRGAEVRGFYSPLAAIRDPRGALHRPRPVRPPNPPTPHTRSLIEGLSPAASLLYLPVVTEAGSGLLFCVTPGFPAAAEAGGAPISAPSFPQAAAPRRLQLSRGRFGVRGAELSSGLEVSQCIMPCSPFRNRAEESSSPGSFIPCGNCGPAVSTPTIARAQEPDTGVLRALLGQRCPGSDLPCASPWQHGSVHGGGDRHLTADDAWNGPRCYRVGARIAWWSGGARRGEPPGDRGASRHQYASKLPTTHCGNDPHPPELPRVPETGGWAPPPPARPTAGILGPKCVVSVACYLHSYISTPDTLPVAPAFLL